MILQHESLGDPLDDLLPDERADALYRSGVAQRRLEQEEPEPGHLITDYVDEGSKGE